MERQTQLTIEPPAFLSLSLSDSLTGSLKSNRRYSEACRVLLDYVSDPEEAVVALLEGSCWDEALRLLHLYRRLDLLDTHLLPGLLEARETQLSQLQAFKDDFCCHSSRLVVVRENKRKKQEAILGKCRGSITLFVQK